MVSPSINVCKLHRGKSPSEKDSFSPVRSLSRELKRWCTSTFVSASTDKINRFVYHVLCQWQCWPKYDFYSFLLLRVRLFDYWEGYMCDLVWVNLRSGWECMRTAKIGPDLRLIGLGKNFFPRPLVIFLTYKSVIFFFPVLYAMKEIFFSVGFFFSPGISLQVLKSQMVGPLEPRH